MRASPPLLAATAALVGCALLIACSTDSGSGTGSTPEGDGGALGDEAARADAAGANDAGAGTDPTEPTEPTEPDPGPPLCGNGTLDPGEECDDGEALNIKGAYGGCNPICKRADRCGDGVVNGPEACDNGPANAPLGTCLPTCAKSNLVLWLDASDPNGDGSLPADATPMALWKDKAENRGVFQGFADRQPKWRAAGIHGKPALEFDGNDDLAVKLNINGTVLPNLTVAVVLQNTAGHPTASAGVWGNEAEGLGRFLTSGGTAAEQGVASSAGFTAVTGLLVESSPLVVVTTLRGSLADQSTVHVNGVLGATFTGTVSAGGTYLCLGNSEDPFSAGTARWATTYFDGRIAEVRIWGEALSDADRTSLEQSLKAKYVP